MLNSVIGYSVTLTSFLICVLTAVVLGILTALIFSRGKEHTGSFAIALAMLPSVVAMVIMLVNGNLGAGLAVAGTFALVRFRSMPGTAKEITGLFFAVSLGLACGMGYVALAAIFFVLMSLFLFCLEKLHFGESSPAERQLKITIPENLDYEGLFDDLLEQYTERHELMRVRTTDMGTLYELTFRVVLRTASESHAFIDALRCRNGNLGISLSRGVDRELM